MWLLSVTVNEQSVHDIICHLTCTVMCLPWKRRADEERKEQGLKCTGSHAENLLASLEAQWRETQPASLPLVANYKVFYCVDVNEINRIDFNMPSCTYDYICIGFQPLSSSACTKHQHASSDIIFVRPHWQTQQTCRAPCSLSRIKSGMAPP